MSERNLSDLLERAAARVDVGAPPIPAMVAGAQRQRRRRALVVASAMAASAAVACGAVAVLTPDGSRSPAPTGPSSPPVASQSSLEPIPPDMRLVGVGHAAIAVPVGWGNNETRCGVPEADTVIIDVGVAEACGTARPRDVDSVEIFEGSPRVDFESDETYEIDGVSAQRQHTACHPGGFGGGEVCAGTVHLPTLGVSFVAESSTSAATVDRILEQIRLVPDQVGVPGYQSINLLGQGDAQLRYYEALEQAGLTVKIRTEPEPPLDPGYILDATPAPGTMLLAGSVVTMTVVAEPAGPADAVRVGISSTDADSEEFQELGDEVIRAGATIELGVGDRIWAHANGRRASTLAGQLDGTALVVDDWVDGPNYPNAWEAVTRGTSTLTLTITADGEPVRLGVVTVRIR